MDLELPVTLVVKAPNQKVDDQTIECGLGWTIKKLKEHISRVYPSRPREHQQKLIYSGRLLYDHLTLKDVLRQYDTDITTHTVHLVCAQSAAETARQDSMASGSSSASSSRGDSPAASPTASPPPASPPPVAEGLRQRRPADSSPTTPEAMPLPTTTAGTTPQPAPDAFQNMYGANMMYGANVYQGMMAPGMMAYSQEQMMWLQQMYAQQMAQYMQLYQGVMPPTPPASPGPVQPQQDLPANQNAAAPNVPDNQRAAGAGGDQPIRMNAQGGMVMDDDDENMNRDWLDWMYTLSRVAVLLSIVYFYSTFTRFVLVLSLFIMAYLYQGGWFRIQRRVARNPQEEQQQLLLQQQQQQQQQELLQQQQQQQQQADQQVPEGQQNQDQTSDEEDSTGAEDGPPAEPPAPGRLTVAWSFFYTFFSSLVPQQPAAINAN